MLIARTAMRAIVFRPPKDKAKLTGCIADETDGKSRQDKFTKQMQLESQLKASHYSSPTQIHRELRAVKAPHVKVKLTNQRSSFRHDKLIMREKKSKSEFHAWI